MLAPPHLFPYTPRALALPDDRGGRVTMRYLDEGAGSPVVMVHGNPSWSFYYRNLVGALRGDHRVVVPDHVGCGASDKPGDDRYAYVLERRVDDLEALLEHAGVTRDVTLVLHDWGGMIGMAYAQRHPERIARLVLMNTAAFLLPPGKRFPLALRFGRDSRLGGALIERHNAFARVAARVGCKRAPMSEEVRRAYVAPYEGAGNALATRRFVDDIPLVPGDRSYALARRVEAGLGAFRDRPVWIGWGGRDFVFDGAFLAEWRRVYPQAEVALFEDAGHYVLEDAAPEVIPQIAAFLARHPIQADKAKATTPTTGRGVVAEA